MEGRRPHSGWFAGIVCGILIGLWVFAPVRYTLMAQLHFALSSNSLGWLQVFDAERNTKERPRLEATAAVNSTDYLLQVGNATALYNARTPSPDVRRDSPGDEEDYTLYNLGRIVRDFPQATGAYAHLARYMTAERIRIQGTDGLPDPADKTLLSLKLSPQNPGRPARPAYGRDARLMIWALNKGEVLDPENAFWPTMRAITLFAALRDDEALQQITVASKRSKWDAYVYEEVLGQWRLYAAAYGDNGAAQKIAPLSLVSFPHLFELRRMAELARWHAERDEAVGDTRDSLRIRRALSRLGVLLRDTAPWAYEALYGTDLVLIANTDGNANLSPAYIRGLVQWEKQAPKFLAVLQRGHRTSELAWIRQEVEASCAFRQRVDMARFDTSLPGSPPGIPLVGLFGYWMAGVYLLTQILISAAVYLLISAWMAKVADKQTVSPLGRMITGVVAIGLSVAAAMHLVLATPTPNAAILCVLSGSALIPVGLEHLFRLRRARAGSDTATPTFRRTRVVLERQWDWMTTAQMLAGLLLIAVVAFPFLIPVLCSLHPVATLLTGLLASPRPLPFGTAILVGILGTALPVYAMICSSIWAFQRGQSPWAGMLIGLRRIALPGIAGLTILYTVMLSHTLQLDVSASHAINEAAQNESKWILTHSEEAPQ